MALSLKPLAALLPWGSKASHADELYGAIVAQARLPVFYQAFGVADSLEGRFVVLSLHLFAVLHRLKEGGPDCAAMAQALADRFTEDMETVLRELGVGDLAVPKKVRKIAASGAELLQSYEAALAERNGSLEAVISGALPGDETAAQAASARLTPYVTELIRNLESEPQRDLCAGTLRFPAI